MEVKQEPPESFVLTLPAPDDDLAADEEEEDEPLVEAKVEPQENCPLVLLLRQLLSDRHRLQSLGDIFKCDKCSFRTTNGILLRNHKGIHEKTCETCVCDKCDKLYLSSEYLKAHQKKVHDEIKAKCEVCGKICRNRESLRSHSQSHVKVECSLCNKTISKKSMAYRHLQKHSADNYDHFKCQLCEFSSKMKRILRVHIQRIHLQKKLVNESKCRKLGNVGNANQFHCDFCGERFQLKWSLKSHMWRHSKERKFRCSMCGFAFKTKRTLLMHSKSCVICEMKFSCKPLPVRHRIEAHGDIYESKVFKCDRCSYQTRNGPCFRKHRWTHDKSISCETCEKKFAIGVSLKVHQMEHRHGIHANAPAETFACDICDKSYSNPSYLKKHKTRVHDKNDFKCNAWGEICKNRYLMLMHLRNHEKVECAICKKMVSKPLIHSHLRVHSFKELQKEDLDDSRPASTRRRRKTTSRS